ncbi:MULTISPECIES: hypothetical protein [unclassified Frankia]|uniref:hypothetical protein n=1 Tax=unclassified Frankia TaxID=2632575 RepID=UPI00070828B7|nr:MULTISPECIES: hypothetical protein [unclassified Frankia]KQM03084.1 hypothetical protein FF86_104820 [Frankia sp. CpI1-P]
MPGVEVALWGLFGGFAVEGLDLYTAVRRSGRWPWRTGRPREVGAWAYLVAEVVRLAIGAGLAAAAAASGQVTTAFAAVSVGIAAPLVVERLARAIPLDPPPAAAPADPSTPGPRGAGVRTPAGPVAPAGAAPSDAPAGE